MKYLLYILPGFFTVLYHRWEAKRMAAKRATLPFKVVPFTSKRGDSEPTVKVVYISNQELMARDPEGVFNHG